MTAPDIRQFVGTIPDKGQSQTVFDTNMDAWLDWTTLQFAPDLVAFGTFASDTSAALVAANLPPLTGRAANMVRVNAAADGVEFRTPAQVLADIGAATTAQGALADSALQSVASLTQTQVEDDASTVFGTVSGQRLAQAVVANLTPSVVLLGTLTTTSGSTQTLSSLDLTPYKVLRAVWNSVSHSGLSAQVFSFAGRSITEAVDNSTNIYGITDIDLLNGIGISSLADLRVTTSADSTVRNIRTSLTNASTSVSVAVPSFSFDLGSIKIYGVK